MKYEDIKCSQPVQSNSWQYAEALVESMEKFGWKGSPILTYCDRLITGSHRQKALQMIASKLDNNIYSPDMEDKMSDLICCTEVAEDVTELVDAWSTKVFEETGEYPEIEYDHLEPIFKGTWVEDYKEQIVEW